MLPYVTLGPWRVETAGLIYALAVLAAGGLYLRRLVRRRFPSGPTARALVWIVVGGGIGANLGGGVGLGYELLSGSPFPVPLKTVSFPGALAGGTVAAWLLSRHYGLPFWWACDQGIVALPLGQAIARLGCLARGCCYGRPTASWPGLYLPDRDGHWVMRYPTQLLGGAVDLLIVAALLAAERFLAAPPDPGVAPARRPGGTLTLLYLGLYLLKRFGVAFWRGDALPGLLGPLNSTHLACAAGLLAVVAAAGWKLRAGRRAGG